MNSFKVVKAYLAKKAQEPIPDSPERRRALEDLNFYSLKDYFEDGLITREEAHSFAVEVLEKYPFFVDTYFEDGLITREEALPYALEVLKESSHRVNTYFEDGLMTREEALPYALGNVKGHPYDALGYFRIGLFTREEALPYALGIVVEEEPRYLVDCVREKLITNFEASTFKHLLEKNVPTEQVADILIRMYKGTLSAEDKKLILGDINHRDLAADHHFGWMSPDQRGKAMGKLPQPLGRSKVDTRVRRNQDVILPASYRRKSRFGEDRETVKNVNSLNRMLGLPLGHDDLGDIHRALLKFYSEGHIGLQEAKAYSDEILAMAKPEERQEIKEQQLSLLNGHSQVV